MKRVAANESEEAANQRRLQGLVERCLADARRKTKHRSTHPTNLKGPK